VPVAVINTYCAKSLRARKPRPLMQRVTDSTDSLVAQYQTESRGAVQ
jgi:hypothetical protein